MTPAKTKPVDWPSLIRAGLVQLRLRPVEFWALTPAELMTMLGHSAGSAPMGRARLADLLRAFPDDSAGSSHERKDADE